MDPTYVPDEAKVRQAAELERRPHTRFIRNPDSDVWHLGLRSEMRGSRSGLLMSVWYRTACSGRKLGGAWGQKEVDVLPAGAYVCPRCAVQAKKLGISYDH